MKAIRFHQWGGPEVLRLEEVPPPIPGPGEVRIRVRAAGVNFADTERRRGLYDAKAPLPLIPGTESAGEVDSVGEGVDRGWLGRRVAALTRNSYAEFTTARADELLELPDHVSFEEGAGLLVQGLTAWHLVHTMGHVDTGHTVLIHAVAGGVGLLALQLAKTAGARVVGTASNASKADLARQYGADEVLTYGPELAERVKAYTEGRGVDLVLDSVGASTWQSSLDSLAPFGHLIAYGNASGHPPPLDVETMYQNSLTVSAYWLRTAFPPTAQRKAREALGQELATGRLQLHLSQVRPLREAADAHAALESRATVGKVILRVD